MLQNKSENENVPRLFRVITDEEQSVLLDEELMSGHSPFSDEVLSWEKQPAGNPADARSGFRRSGIPGPKRDSSSIIDRVPTTYLRRIQNELESGAHDARTVLSACRGLEPGSKEFATKYFAARLSALQESKARIGLPVAVGAVSPASDSAPFEEALPVIANEGANPYIIRFPAELFHHFGIWITAVVGLELWNSWKIALVLDQYLLGGVWFFGVSLFFGFFLLNTAVWFRFRNSLSSRFLLPGGILLVSLFVLAAALHFHQAIPVAD